MTLRLLLDVPPGPLRRSTGAEVEVTLVNDGPDPVVVNGRMGPGYADSISREVFFDLDGAYRRQKYERDLSATDDYRELGTGQSVRARIDLLAWYRVTEPGHYRLTAHYQCDEPAARPPAGIFRGIVSSEQVPIEVV